MLLCRLILLISALSVFSVMVNAQVNTKETVQQQPDSSQDAWYSATAREIASSNRTVRQETLNDDILVIKAAAPTLHEILLGEGFTKVDAGMITSAAWREFRTGHPNDKLERDKFIRFALEEFGILEVTSKPDEADIQVDDKQWTDKTNAENGVKVGTRHVRVSKAGYEDAEGDREVKKGQRALFHADLKPKRK